jgi:hypothetical protein
MSEETDISNAEIIAETFQAIRVQELKKVEQVKAVMLERFPNISDERRQECLVDLATIMCKANPEVFSSKTRKPRIGR